MVMQFARGSRLMGDGPLHNFSNLLLKLHRLVAAGQGDSVDADSLRDLMDAPWHRMSSQEQAIARQLSSDLYTIDSSEVNQHPTDPTIYTQSLASELTASSQQGNYLEALRLIQNRPTEISQERAAMLRGVCYEKFGLFDAGLEFFEHSARVSHDPESINVFILGTLLIHGRTEDAAKRARRMLSESRATINLRLTCAEILFALAAKTSGENRIEIAREAEAQYLVILQEVASIAGQHISQVIAHCHSMLAACYIIQERRHDALRHISQAIEADPTNEFFYVQRGLQTTSVDFQAAKADFKKAIELGTQDCWSYYYLALDALKSQNYDLCLSLCEAAIRRTDDLELLGMLHEWTAISLASRCETLAQLPVDLIRHHFKLAMSLSPLNRTVLENFKSFESTLREARAQTRWEIGAAIDPSEIMERTAKLYSPTSELLTPSLTF
jgi:tetratricopeptide (TPR) repeat protein